MNLAKFIAVAEKRQFPFSQYVDEPGFEHLYVRFGKWFIDGKWHPRVLTIANVQAEEPGKGTFTKLIERIKHDWPDVGIYVECVHNQRLAKWLMKNGFRLTAPHPNCYNWIPNETS